MIQTAPSVKGNVPTSGKCFETMPLSVCESLRESTDLGAVEFTALHRLRLCAWQRGGMLPDDDALLAKYTGLSRSRWLKVRPAIEGYFLVGAGLWIEENLQKKLDFLGKKYEKLRQAGGAGGTAKALKSKETGLADAVANAVADAVASPPEMLLESRIKKEVSKKEDTGLRPDADASSEAPEATPSVVGVEAAAKVAPLPSSVVEFDPAAELFGPLLAALALSAGKDPKAVRPMIAKLMNSVGACDARLILKQALEMHDPLSWFCGAVKARCDRRTVTATAEHTATGKPRTAANAEFLRKFEEAAERAAALQAQSW